MRIILYKAEQYIRFLLNTYKKAHATIPTKSISQRALQKVFELNVLIYTVQTDDNLSYKLMSNYYKHKQLFPKILQVLRLEYLHIEDLLLPYYEILLKYAEYNYQKYKKINKRNQVIINYLDKELQKP